MYPLHLARQGRWQTLFAAIKAFIGRGALSQSAYYACNDKGMWPFPEYSKARCARPSCASLAAQVPDHRIAQDGNAEQALHGRGNLGQHVVESDQEVTLNVDPISREQLVVGCGLTGRI